MLSLIVCAFIIWSWWSSCSLKKQIFCGFQRRTESKYPTAREPHDFWWIFVFKKMYFSSAAYFQKCAIFLNSTAILTGKVSIWIPLKCCKNSIEIVFFCFDLEDQWPGKIPKCDRDRNWNRSHFKFGGSGEILDICWIFLHHTLHWMMKGLGWYQCALKSLRGCIDGLHLVFWSRKRRKLYICTLIAFTEKTAPGNNAFGSKRITLENYFCLFDVWL